MPKLFRQDGVEYIIQPYRELLSYKKAALLKKEIKLLALNHGDFVRLYRQNDGQVQAVFSKEPGILLGETVWRYFNRPQDMIYCEVLDDHHEAILVIVRGSKICVDACIPLRQLHEEFMSISSSYNYYQIFIYGDVPLSDIPQDGKFVFEQSRVKKFTLLDESLFENLPVDDSFQLLFLEEAMLNQNIWRQSHKFAFITFGVLMLLIGYSWLYNSQSSSSNKLLTSLQQPQKIYQSLSNTPDPGIQIKTMADSIKIFYFIPGWVAENMTLTNNLLSVKVNSLGGLPSQLKDWVDKHNLLLQIAPTGAVVNVPLNLQKRKLEKNIPPTENSLSLILDKMMRILPSNCVSYKAIRGNEVFNSAIITLSLSDISPSVLAMIGENIQGFPLKLEQCQLSVNQGLLSGRIKLSLIGTSL